MLRDAELFMDRSEPALIPERNINLAVNSHGSTVFGRLLMPAVLREGERPPVAMILHGYPGNERNMDVPPALRRAGFAAAYFSYRGVWGSHGDYCFSHMIQDVHAVLAHLREHEAEYGIDMYRAYLVGHSMGGFATINALAEGAAVKGAVVLAPCDMGYQYLVNREGFDHMMLSQRKGYFTTPDEAYLENDVAANARRWQFMALADRIPMELPVHFIGGSQDTVTPPDVHIAPLYACLSRRGQTVSYTELPDGHAFPGHRIALTRLIFQKLAAMEGEL